MLLLGECRFGRTKIRMFAVPTAKPLISSQRFAYKHAHRHGLSYMHDLQCMAQEFPTRVVEHWFGQRYRKNTVSRVAPGEVTQKTGVKGTRTSQQTPDLECARCAYDSNAEETHGTTGPRWESDLIGMQVRLPGSTWGYCAKDTATKS